MDLQDVLAKPEWPAVQEANAAEIVAIIDQIIAPLAVLKDPKQIPDLFEHVTVGFNSTMAAVETCTQKPLLGVIVCRSITGPDLSAPFAIASAAAGFSLVSVPFHSGLRVANGIIGVRKSLNNKKLASLVEKVGPVQTNWQYKPASLQRRVKNPSR